MPPLQIYDRRERAIVGAADAVLASAAVLARPFRRRARPGSPARILLLRLERIGDLIMALPAIRDVRLLAPSAEIDLVVGSWNAAIAEAIPDLTRVETLDAPWLARGARGATAARLLAAARRWRTRHYDLAINFEPDIRSNLLMAVAGARWTAGWTTGGGGAVLDQGLAFDPRAHTTTNARRLTADVFGRVPDTTAQPLLMIPESARRSADASLAPYAPRLLVGVHVSGGRLVKQWEPARFADVARRLAASHDATILLTGAADDRPMVDEVKRAVPAGQVLDVAGSIDLIELAALIERCHVFVTGDTGPMHIATAVRTPVVAVFGPSDPARYAPSGPADRIVRVDLPCSPCNRIRKPPAHCVGVIPECLTSIPSDRVYEAALAALEESRQAPRDRPRHATA